MLVLRCSHRNPSHGSNYKAILIYTKFHQLANAKLCRQANAESADHIGIEKPYIESFGRQFSSREST